MCPTFALKVYYKTLDYTFAESARYRHMVRTTTLFQNIRPGPFCPPLDDVLASQLSFDG